MSHDFLNHGHVRLLFAEPGTKGVAQIMCAEMRDGFWLAMLLLRLSLFCGIVLIENTSNRAINIVGTEKTAGAIAKDKIGVAVYCRGESSVRTVLLFI